ncbi:MAG: hypothetical protein IPO15_21990 [Anaerolineae bacterium]|uniref:TRAFAC clade GTPase domain-containing protein n=1 Tax=Candidatus Amarolinea dominans TaxID=3140696 RepID=UPI0031374FD1|nr:hypothetical protein [Anaerolineae bacterium]
MLCPYCLQNAFAANCSNCEKDLPPLYLKRHGGPSGNPAILSAVGFSGHGKTVYLAALLHTMGRHLTSVWPRFYRQALDMDSVRTVQANLAMLQRGELPPSTRRNFPLPSLHLLAEIPQYNSRHLIIYDPPGEAFNSDEGIETYAHFVQRARVVLFLVSLVDLDEPKASDLHRLLEIYVLGMAKMKAQTRHQHLIVAYTKADRLQEVFARHPSVLAHLSHAITLCWQRPSAISARSGPCPTNWRRIPNATWAPPISSAWRDVSSRVSFSAPCPPWAARPKMGAWRQPSNHAAWPTLSSGSWTSRSPFVAQGGPMTAAIDPLSPDSVADAAGPAAVETDLPGNQPPGASTDGPEAESAQAGVVPGELDAQQSQRKLRPENQDFMRVLRQYGTLPQVFINQMSVANDLVMGAGRSPSASEIYPPPGRDSIEVQVWDWTRFAPCISAMPPILRLCASCASSAASSCAGRCTWASGRLPSVWRRNSAATR